MSPEQIFSLGGRVAIVTGGAKGNGKSIATGLIACGAEVYLIDNSQTDLERTCEEIGEGCYGICEDVTNYSRIQHHFDTIFKKHGHIDILFNNAGISKASPSEKYPIDFWNQTIEINLSAPFRLSQIVFPYMLASKKGVIVNITSLCSELGASENPSYVSSKGGLKLLTRALAKDWAKHNIRVNNLGLGYFQTSMTSKSFNDPDLSVKRTSRTMIDRWGTAADLIGPAIFLASDASQFMTGQDLYIDGGFLANGI